MKELIIFLETLGNLASIPRSGGILFAGLKPSDVDTIAEHSYKTACIALLLAKIVKKNKIPINIGLLLEYAISHDWSEAVLWDTPTGSPSYASYFEADIRTITQNAEKNVRKAIEKYLNDHTGISIDETILPPNEKSILQIADTMAFMLEILEWKYRGLNYEWLDYMWANIVVRLKQNIEESKFTFLHELATAIDKSYKYGKKKTHPFLTKKEFQKLKANE